MTATERARIPSPVAGLDVRPYSRPRARRDDALLLDGNEGSPDISALSHPPQWNEDLLRRYPNDAALRETLATRYGVAEDRVVLGAGADEILDRLTRAYLDATRNVVHHGPTFEMIERYVRISGAEKRVCDWPSGPFPFAAVADLIDDETGLCFLVTPNNPTGATIPADGILALAAEKPTTLFAVDLAYVEYAESDPTKELLEARNVVVVRTLSKGLGLAGLRIGFALGATQVIAALRSVGSPYPVSALSCAVATTALTQAKAPSRHVAAVIEERDVLNRLVTDLGGVPRPSHANFLLIDGLDAPRAHASLDALGVRVRSFPDRPGLQESLRITLPGRPHAFTRLTTALRTALAPQAILFDVDGVLVDVRESYDATIRRTAARFGVDVTEEDIARAKAAGDCNDDWELTRALITERGRDAALDDVIARFESLYRGSADKPGLRERERLLVDRHLLVRLAAARPLAVITGRPRRDAEDFIARFELEDVFSTVVSREDADAMKPSPAPVIEALRLLGVEHAWMLGDTPDDMRAAIAADVLPVGMPAPGRCSDDLERAGAAFCLNSIASLESLLP